MFSKKNDKIVNVKKFEDLSEEVKESWSIETRMAYEASVLAFKNEFRE